MSSNIRAGRAFVEIFLKDKLSGQLKRLQRRMKNIGAGMSQIGRRLGAAGIAIGAPIAVATRIFASFADQMAKVKAVTGASAADFGTLNERAKELGRTTSFTASQVAGAMVELGRAGFRPQAIDNAIAGVLSLARATDTELPRAAEIAGAALRGFSLASSEAGRVADVLTATANNSSQGLEDIGEALKVVAPLAVEAGESLEDTNAALGVLANNGIKGSLAGNSLARAFKNLSTSKAQQLLRSVGVEAVDGAGNLRKLAAILSELGQATKTFGSGKKLELFESLFGRGQAAALKLASPTASFKDLQDVLNQSQGTAKKTAATMDNTLGGSFRKLSSAVEGIAIAFGEALQGPLGAVTNLLSRAAGFVTKFVSSNKVLVLSLAALAAGLLATGVVLAGLGVVVSAVGSLFVALAAAISFTLSPVGLVIAAIGILAVEYSVLAALILTKTNLGAKALGFLAERFGFLKDDALEAFDGIKKALAGGDIELAAGILFAGLNVVWQTGVLQLTKVWIGFKRAFLQVAAIAVKGVMALFGVSVTDLVDLWASLEIAWTNFTSFLADAWSIFTAGFQKNWSGAQNRIAKGILHLMGLFDRSLDVKGAIADLDAAAAQRSQSIGQQRDRTIAGSEKRRTTRLAEIESSKADKKKQIDAFLSDAQRNAGLDQQGIAAESKLAEARKALAGLVDQARNLSTASAVPDSARQQADAMGAGVASMSAPIGANTTANTAVKLSSDEGISAVANVLRGSSGQSVQQKTAKNTADLVALAKKTNANLRELALNSREPPSIVEVSIA